jgi:tRNA(Ile)-lysidine synthase
MGAMDEDLQIDGLARRLAADWPLAAWDGVHVLAAVSGGPDSMALLRALLELKRAGGVSGSARGTGAVMAGHVNHGLRGRSSDDDEAWLRQQCEQLGVALVVRRGDVGALAAQGDGIEAAAREQRYELLTAMAEEAGARFVATAHTRDDQAETVLFRLVRGSGLRGLAGMRRTRALSPSVALVRPLLACSRGDVRAYLAAIGQTWREDPTNADFKFARNRIRGELLPYLREHFNAEADEALVRAGELAGAAQEFVESLAEEALARCGMCVSAGVVSLDARPLADQPPLLAVEALRAAWRAAGWPQQAMTHLWWRQLAELAQAVEARPGLNLPGNVLARRLGETLELRRA